MVRHALEYLLPDLSGLARLCGEGIVHGSAAIAIAGKVDAENYHGGHDQQADGDADGH
jgi:hypothetical protein